MATKLDVVAKVPFENVVTDGLNRAEVAVMMAMVAIANAGGLRTLQASKADFSPERELASKISLGELGLDYLIFRRLAEQGDTEIKDYPALDALALFSVRTVLGVKGVSGDSFPVSIEKHAAKIKEALTKTFIRCGLVWVSNPELSSFRNRSYRKLSNKVGFSLLDRLSHTVEQSYPEVLVGTSTRVSYGSEHGVEKIRSMLLSCFEIDISTVGGQRALEASGPELYAKRVVNKVFPSLKVGETSAKSIALAFALHGFDDVFDAFPGAFNPNEKKLYSGVQVGRELSLLKEDFEKGLLKKNFFTPPGYVLRISAEGTFDSPEMISRREELWTDLDENQKSVFEFEVSQPGFKLLQRDELVFRLGEPRKIEVLHQPNLLSAAQRLQLKRFADSRGVNVDAILGQ